ncbi:hypothetical protein [Thalassotalea atypica]|uniref:hypothetical protein n=1 Tax=Thalassotalea atypica TaxID=2054316 RepID=UPI0025722589|nr:hypothetical protein [Thalassotalea atypica]
MPKLTPEQVRLLTWLAIVGDVFAVRFVKSKQQFNYLGLHHYVNADGEEYKFDIRTLKKLIRCRLVRSRVNWHFGIKWKSYELNESGQVYASLMCATKETSWSHLKRN